MIMQGEDYHVGWVMKDAGCPGDFDKVIIILITGSLTTTFHIFQKLYFLTDSINWKYCYYKDCGCGVQCSGSEGEPKCSCLCNYSCPGSPDPTLVKISLTAHHHQHHLYWLWLVLSFPGVKSSALFPDDSVSLSGCVADGGFLTLTIA